MNAAKYMYSCTKTNKKKRYDKKEETGFDGRILIHRKWLPNSASAAVTHIGRRVSFLDKGTARGAPTRSGPRAAAQLHLAALRPRQCLSAGLATQARDHVVVAAALRANRHYPLRGSSASCSCRLLLLLPLAQISLSKVRNDGAAFRQVGGDGWHSLHACQPGL